MQPGSGQFGRLIVGAHLNFWQLPKAWGACGNGSRRLQSGLRHRLLAPDASPQPKPARPRREPIRALAPRTGVTACPHGTSANSPPPRPTLRSSSAPRPNTVVPLTRGQRYYGIGTGSGRRACPALAGGWACLENAVGRGQCHTVVAQRLRWGLCPETTAQKLRCGAPRRTSPLRVKDPQVWHETNMTKYRTKEMNGKA